MIHVDPQPEYPEFDLEVRTPGLRFLEMTPCPSSRDFNRHNYWNKARKHLHRSYSGLCAYTSLYLEDSDSVDHFLPKTKYPHLAYEWDNYRLARQKVNFNKGSSEQVLDPFTIQNGWFVMDCPSCLITPGPGLDSDTKTQVENTIGVLKLNADDGLVQERCDWLVSLAKDEITLDFLRRRYPFLASEITRQGIEQDLKTVFCIG